MRAPLFSSPLDVIGCSISEKVSGLCPGWEMAELAGGVVKAQTAIGAMGTNSTPLSHRSLESSCEKKRHLVCLVCFVLQRMML